jgi:hypothetical protein
VIVEHAVLIVDHLNVVDLVIAVVADAMVAKAQIVEARIAALITAAPIQLAQLSPVLLARTWMTTSATAKVQVVRTKRKKAGT